MRQTSLYGKLFEELENDFTKGHNNYPTDMVKAYQLLNEYKSWRPASSAPQSEGVAFAQKGKQEDTSNKDWAADKTCYQCGEKGHIKPNCPLFNKKGDKKDEHDRDDSDRDSQKQAASKKKTEKEKKMKTFMQKLAEEDGADETGPDELSFTNIGDSKLDKVKLKNMLLLDNQSTVDLFCNKLLVENIRQVRDAMTVMGNGGKLSINTKADLVGYGEVWFDERAITNILSWKNVSQKQGFRVSYDSVGNQGFTIHKPNGKVIHFPMHPDGLHYHNFTNPEVTFIQTVKENEEGYSQRQLEQARVAKDLYTKVGHPSQQDFKAMVAGGMILNCPVTVVDVIRAEKIYGPSIAALKGKTVRSSPKKVVTEDLIELPKQILEANSIVALSADVFFVNTIPFFTSISKDIKFTTTENIPTRTAKQLVTAFKHVLAIYKKRGFHVETALMDGEFAPLKAELLEMGVHLNITSANKHVRQTNTCRRSSVESVLSKNDHDRHVTICHLPTSQR